MESHELSSPITNVAIIQFTSFTSQHSCCDSIVPNYLLRSSPVYGPLPTPTPIPPLFNERPTALWRASVAQRRSSGRRIRSISDPPFDPNPPSNSISAKTISDITAPYPYPPLRACVALSRLVVPGLTRGKYQVEPLFDCAVRNKEKMHSRD